MEKINRIISGQSKLRRFSGPLQAAHICQAAQSLASGRYSIVSFKNGLLTAGVESSADAAALFPESQKIIDELNRKLGGQAVEKIRFKIVAGS